MKIKKRIEVEIEVKENMPSYCSLNPWCKYLEGNEFGICSHWGELNGSPNYWLRCQQCLDEFGGDDG